ncbi:conjugal transfer protein [Salicibibacter cibi]|uniref:Conjugal transfer protein n=1 Tax=Salicibibacter cibi TaxID=2743001 RepID=A0A7T6ZA31_9BACI|nr:conjugal transfer protein [Salicibibacter cibi]QQK79512.1 conjugal transfer protein [Salicibibacter cibi]
MKQRKANIHKPEKEKAGIRKDTSKRTAFAVWGLIGGLLFFSILAAMLSINTRSTFNDLRAAVDDEEEGEEEEADLDVVSADYFLRDFVDAYINVSDDPDELEERRGELENFMVSMDTESEWNMVDVEMEGERRLDNVELFHIDETEEGAVFEYEVTYISDNGDGTTEEQILLLNVPIIEDDGQYAVSGEPYFTDIDDLSASVTVEEEERNVDEYVGDEQEEILAFLDEFFEQYATGDEDDLSYMMQDPESLNGAFAYEGMVDESIEEQEEGFSVYTDVHMVDDVTGMNYEFEVTLYLERMNENYIVENIEIQ